MKKNILRSVLTVLFGFAFLGFSQGNSFAATKASSANTTAPNTQTSVLKVSPLRTDITVQAGASTKVKTYVTNITNTPIELQPIENDFVSGPEENGTPALILNANQYAPTHSLKRFMEPLPTDITVPSGGTSEVDVTINVPKTAQAGGYFGAVRFAPANTSGNQQVNLSESVASLILLTVPGPTVEKMNLTNFDIEQNGASGTNFHTNKNLSLYMRFENQGNFQEAPFGQIYVTKGKKQVYSYNFNQKQPQDEVLPDSARKWTVPLSGFGHFGKYTVGATLTYGVNKQESLDITKTIWIVPTAYIFAAVGAIILIILIILGIWFFLRSYKRRILRSSGGNSNHPNHPQQQPPQYPPHNPQQ